MKYAPHVAGAVVAVAIAGAVSGAAIGDSPVLTRDYPESLPGAPILAVSNEAMQSAKRPPDHYPLKTPDGTVEVSELAYHGRLRDERRAMWWDDGEERRRLSAEYDFYDAASPERIEHERRLLAFHGVETSAASAVAQAPSSPNPPAPTRAEGPMALSEPAEISAEPTRVPVAEASVGNAKTIDVTKALADGE